MKVCLSANARPQLGGQGVNLAQMIAGLEFLGHVPTVFQAGQSSRWIRVRGSRIARYLSRVPLLRRKRDWIVRLDGRAFDHYVAHHIPSADVFQGVTGQCVRSLVSAAKRGIEPVLDSVTEHIDGLGEAMDASCSELDVVAPLGVGLRERMHEEYGAARRIRVMSSVAQESFVRHGVPADKVYVVRPFIDIPDETLDPSRHSEFRVSFVGLIEPWKGIKSLLAGYGAVRTRDTRLYLWGNTGSRAMTRLIREARVRDTTIETRGVDVQQSGLASVYGESSILVHPSLSDGFGLVVLEAMATGVPVIVSAASGASDLVEEGVNGFVVPPGNAEAISARLEYLRDRPGKLTEMGVNARKKASEMTLTRFGQAYERFLNG